MVVFGVYLDEHIVTARGIMTFGNLWYLPKLLNHFVKTRWILKEQAYVSTGLIPYFLRIDDKLRAFQYSQCCEFLNALVNRRTTNITRACYFQEWNASVCSYKS